MSASETILYEVDLPEFADRFRINCINYLLPPLEAAITAVEQLSDPVLLLLIGILLLQLLRVALVKDSQGKSNANNPELQAMSKEVRDLKRQVKGIQKALQQVSLDSVGVAPQSQSRQVDVSAVLKVMEECRQSWSRREEIAMHILDYQTRLMGEVKKIKSKSRISSPSKVRSTAGHSAAKPKASSEIKANRPVSTTLKPSAHSVIQNQPSKSARPESTIQQESVSFPKHVAEPTAEVKVLQAPLQKINEVPLQIKFDKLAQKELTPVKPKPQQIISKPQQIISKPQQKLQISQGQPQHLPVAEQTFRPQNTHQLTTDPSEQIELPPRAEPVKLPPAPKSRKGPPPPVSKKIPQKAKPKAPTLEVISVEQPPAEEKTVASVSPASQSMEIASDQPAIFADQTPPQTNEVPQEEPKVEQPSTVEENTMPSEQERPFDNSFAPPSQQPQFEQRVIQIPAVKAMPLNRGVPPRPPPRTGARGKAPPPPLRK